MIPRKLTPYSLIFWERCRDDNTLDGPQVQVDALTPVDVMLTTKYGRSLVCVTQTPHTAFAWLDSATLLDDSRPVEREFPCGEFAPESHESPWED